MHAKSLLAKGIAVLIGAAFALGCATSPESEQNTAEEESEQFSAEELKQQIRQALEERIQEGLDTTPATRAERLERAKTALQNLHARVYDDFLQNVESQFGVPGLLRTETVELEAIDAEGNTVTVPVDIQTRPLRVLTDADLAPRMRNFVREDDQVELLYSELPEPINPDEVQPFFRVYTGESAEAIAMEARLIVSTKGGEWLEPDGEERVANAVAVRGLDLARGLGDNSNLTYDDTMYVVLQKPGDSAEVHEYRMTTESSSSKRGVGRLDARQVYYVRGKHRGKDPAFRLLGNRAAGTRAGMEGTYDIVGANIHSAYSGRPITSDTPLRPNISLGCQVIAASKSDFESYFVYMLDKKNIKQFPYTIVSDDELHLWDSSLREKEMKSVLAGVLPREETQGPGEAADTGGS